MMKVVKGKKKASVLLALTLAGTMILGACGSNNEKGNEAAGGEATSGKKVTLKVEVFDRGNTPSGLTITNNYLTKYVQDNFGTPK